MTNRMATKILGSMAVLFASLALPAAAHAVPALQVYIPGAQYIGETWVLDTNQSGGTVVITATTKNGGGEKVGDLYNVHMVVSALSDTEFSAALSGGDGNLDTGIKDSNPGSTPVLNGGDANQAASYIDFGLGNFTGTPDETQDWPAQTPAPEGLGNEQTYTLTLTNLTGTVIIDAYGYFNSDGTGKVKAAPYSHNGAITPGSTSVPELSGRGAGSAVALLLGVGLFFGSRRRRSSN